MDDKLNWNDHFWRVGGKINKGIWMMKCLRGVVGIKNMVMVYNAMINSHLMYCISVLGKLNNGLLNKIKGWQIKAIRTMMGNRDVEWSEVGKTFGILRMEDMIYLNTLVKVHERIYEGKHREVIDVREREIGRNLRLSRGYILNRIRTEYGRNRIGYLGVKWWGELSEEIREIKSKVKFKRRLKEEIIARLS